MTIDEHIKILELYSNGGYAGCLQETVNVAINTMRKYQEIQEIIKKWGNGRCSDAACCLNIKAVVDGNVD